MKKLIVTFAVICFMLCLYCVSAKAEPPKVDVNIEKKTPKVDVNIEKIDIPAEKEKFHLYLLIGQSNMVGTGAVTEEDKKLHTRVFNFDKDQKWVQAKDPLHTRGGVGMGLTFGKDIANNVDPSISVGLIPCAVGGTPLRRWVKGGDLYRIAVARAKEAMKKGELKGIIWHQGESDSTRKEDAETYGARLQGMINDIRKDLGNDNLPFIVGELGHFCNQVPRFNLFGRVNQELNLIPKKVKNTFCVSAKDLTNRSPRDVHFSTEGYHGLGHRYANAMLKMIDKKYLTSEAKKKIQEQSSAPSKQERKIEVRSFRSQTKD